jgi:hypothetical protein
MEEKLNDYTAYFPEKDDYNKSYPKQSFVKIKANGKDRILVAAIRLRASGNDILVSPKVLKKLGGEAEEAEATKIGAWRYWFYALFHHHFLIFIGFILALFGVLVDGALKLGERGIGWDISASMGKFLKISSFVAGVLGTFLLFFKALKKGE